MIDKIKAFAQACGDIILYVLTPVAFVAGYIWYLLGQNKKLKEELNQTQFKVTQNATKTEEVKDDKEANDAVSNYDDLLKQYNGISNVSPSSPGVRPGGQSPTVPDPNQGPKN